LDRDAAEYIVESAAELPSRLPRGLGGGMTALLRERLVIGGWVAMWRPLEIFLYDWWPILGEQRTYDRLSRIEVRVVHDDPRHPTTSPASSPRPM
jgi:hypothetical protein